VTLSERDDKFVSAMTTASAISMSRTFNRITAMVAIPRPEGVITVMSNREQVCCFFGFLVFANFDLISFCWHVRFFALLALGRTARHTHVRPHPVIDLLGTYTIHS
jgi:hypothetical protein